MKSKDYRNQLILLLSVILLVSSTIYAGQQNDFRSNGDAYMSVLYAKVIEQEQQINFDIYNENAGLWGKEGKIYFTPALHIITYTLKNTLGLNYQTTIYIFLILFAIFFLLLVYQFGNLIDPNFTPFFCVFYVITFMRDKRYYLTPGYHFQNVFGEFLLLVLLYIILKATMHYFDTKKISWKQLLVIGTVYISIFFFHQLTFFITTILLLFLAAYLFFELSIYKKIFTKQGILLIAGLTLVGILVTIILAKIGYLAWIFDTFKPLSTDSYQWRMMRPILGYGELLWNNVLVFGSFISLIYLFAASLRMTKRNRLLLTTGILLPAAIILLLTKGPLMHIKILPMRTLWYYGFFSIAAMSCMVFMIVKKYSLQRTQILLALLLVLSMGTAAIIPPENGFVNIDASDSAPNKEILELADIIQTEINAGQYVDITHTACRSCIWIRTFVVPYEKIYFMEKDFYPAIADIIITDDKEKHNLTEYSVIATTEHTEVLKRR